MSLLSTLALALLPAIRAKTALPATIGPPSRALLAELDIARRRVRDLEGENEALQTTLEQAWARNDELMAERDRARRTVDQLTDMLNCAPPRELEQRYRDLVQRELEQRNLAQLEQYRALQQAQQFNAMAQCQNAQMLQQQVMNAQNLAYQRGFDNQLHGFCNCVPARHDAFNGHVSGD